MAGRPRRTTAPGKGESLFVILTLFLLAYSLPSSWFVADNGAVATGESSVIVVFLLLFGWAVTRLMGQWDHVVRAVRREPFLLAFILLGIASTAWSTSPDVTLRRSVAMLLTTAFAYYLVVRFPLREILRLLAITLGIGTLLNLFWIVAVPKYGITHVEFDTSKSGDWSGVFLQKNELGRSAIVGVVTFVIVARLIPRRRLLCYAFALLNVVLLLGADSKTGLVTLILVLPLMALFSALRAKRTLAGGVAVALAGTAALAAAFVTTNLGPITETLGRDATLTGRTQLWADVWHSITQKPILGYGWSAFWAGGENGPSRAVLEHNTWNPPDAHNALLEYMLALGFIGAALFLVVVLRGLPRAVRHVRRVPGTAGIWPLTFLTLVTLLSITEKGVANRDINWVLFVVAVTLVGRDRVVRRPRRQARHVPSVPLRPLAPAAVGDETSNGTALDGVGRVPATGAGAAGGEPDEAIEPTDEPATEPA
jgi:O-antigen ligase